MKFLVVFVASLIIFTSHLSAKELVFDYKNNFGNALLSNLVVYDGNIIFSSKGILNVNQSVVLDFDSDIRDSIFYSVLKSEFDLSKDSFFGKYAAKFYKSSHVLAFLVNSRFLAPKIQEYGNFSIFFAFKITKMENENKILSIVIPEKGSRGFSLDIGVSFSRVKVALRKIAFDDTGEPISVELFSDTKVKEDKWYEVSLVFDVNRSRVILYLDGIQEAVASVKNLSSQFLSEELIIEIGKEMVGLFDEFVITGGIMKSLMDKQPYQGEIISDVIDLGKLGAEIKSIKVDGKLKNYLVEARSSDDLKNLVSGSVEWVSGDNISNLKGRYFQYRVKIFNEPIGKVSIERIRLDVFLPSDVFKHEIVFIDIPNNGEITIGWNYSLDEEVDYYEIYYGYKTSDYFGTDAVNGISPIYIKKPQKFYPLLKYTLKGLDSSKVYYLAIRAVSKNGTKSDFSKEIKVRPLKQSVSQSYSFR